MFIYICIYNWFKLFFYFLFTDLHKKKLYYKLKKQIVEILNMIQIFDGIIYLQLWYKFYHHAIIFLQFSILNGLNLNKIIKISINLYDQILSLKKII